MMNNEILERFAYCPVCGSKHFDQQNFKSKKCQNCGFEYYTNPSAATAAFIINNEGQLLVLTRKKEPAKGTLDLPGGFCDIGETLEQGIRREVEEETGLIVDKAEYLFSFPNKYRYSNLDIPTLDAFFRCEVSDLSPLHAMDDAAKAQWISLNNIRTELFGLRSIRQALFEFTKL
ncbi:MAG: NUDIX domain-containing protein [Prevotella sp.]